MQHLKKVFCLLLLFYFSFHFLMPATFYLIMGYTPTYQTDYFSIQSILKGGGLNLASILLAGVLIYFTKLNFTYKPRADLRSSLYLIIAILVTVIDINTASSFADKIKGQGGGNIFIVMCSLMFNVESYILFAFASSSSFFPSSGLIFVFFKLLLASRSAPLTLVNIFLCSLASPNLKKYWKRYSVVVLISVVFSFQGYKWASLIREKSFSDDSSIVTVLSQETSGIPQDNRSVTTRIVGRISFLENMMVPIYYKDVLKMDRSNIFYDKYSLSNQLKILVNNLVPGDIFEYDVYPNQYYRSAFLKLDPAISKTDYTSINMTLPVFFYMYWGSIVSVLISAALIWGYFMATAHIARIHPLFGFVFLSGLVGNFLAFFDIVMLVKMNLFGLMAATIFMLLSKITPDTGKFKWRKS